MSRILTHFVNGETLNMRWVCETSPRSRVSRGIGERKNGRGCFIKPADTVGELGRVENCASRMASLKAQDHGNAYAERLAWESGNRFANSIGWFSETPCHSFPTPGGNVAKSLLFGVMSLASSSLSHLSAIEQHRRAAVTKRVKETHPIHRRRKHT